MTVMARRSSTTARVSRNARSAVGRWVDSTASTASANAMSVAIGTAHPSRFSGRPAARLMAMKIAAGTTIPPTAAAIGRAARRGSRRSPATNSRLSSNPTTKKKMASSPSAAHPETGRRRWSDSGPTANSDIARYACIHGEFAHTNAAPAATSSRIPPTVSLRRISEKRCVSDHEPRVSSRLGVSIAESLVILGDIRIRLPGRPLYGIFTCGAPGSLVGSRTAGDDFRTAAGVATWRCNRGSVQFGAAKEFPVVTLNSNALDAVRLLATRRLPGLVVTDTAGIPVTILPASQVVRLLVPPYVQEDPSLAGVLSESMADRVADKLGGKTVGEVLPKPPPDMATVKSDDTIVEVAAIMARSRSPLVAVMSGEGLVGVITAARILEVALAH